MVAHIDVAVLVELVGIGGEDSRHGEGVALGELEADVHVEVAPRLRLGCHVIAHGHTQLVDETYLLLSRRVSVGPQLHLEVVGDVQLDAAVHAAGSRAVDTAAEGRIGDGGDVAVPVRADVGVVHSPHRLAEVRRIVERDAGRYHVPDGLYLLPSEPRQRRIVAIQLRVGTDAHREVIDIVEAVHRVALHLHRLLVPRLHDLLRVHAVGEREVGRHVDILQDAEAGVDGNLVTHAVPPVLDEAALEEQVLLGVDAVRKRTGIAHGNLLVPSLLARHLLSLEGIEAVELDGEVWQGEGNAAVPDLLGKVERAAQRQPDVGERLAVGDTAGSGALRIALRIVHADEVVALVAACGEVDACREALRRVGLRVLTVRPRHLEALRRDKVRHVLLARLRVLVAEVKVSAEAVTLLVGGLLRQRPGALRVDVGQQLGVHIVVEGKIISALTQIEASRRLVAIARHDEAAAVFLLEGEEAVRNRQRQRHIADHEVSWAEHHILARAHLGPRHVQVEVGMLGIASRIESLLDIHRAAAVALAVEALHVALALLRVDIGDVSLARLEVIADAVRLILVGTLAEERLARDGTSRVRTARGVDKAAVNGNIDDGSLELEVLILHPAVAVKVSTRAAIVEGDRVLGRVVDRHVEGILAPGRRIGRHSVLRHGVRQDGIGTQRDAVPQQRVNATPQECHLPCRTCQCQCRQDIARRQYR